MTLSWMPARGAERMHRWFWASSLSALLVVASACETNGLLFTNINSNMPSSEADAGTPPVDDDDEPPVIDGDGDPDTTPGGGGSSSSAGGSNASGGSASGSSGASGTSGTAPPDDGGGGGTALPGDPDEPGAGSGGAGSGGAGSGGAGSGGAGSGSGGDIGEGSEEPPPNDNSCGDVCLRRGGRCFEGTCFFDCDEPGSCSTDQVICPSGWPCEVRCGDGACEQNVICSLYSQCNIRCEGEGSCERQVICEGDCDITCSGVDSCRAGIGGSVELLELECSGQRSCAGTVSCEGQDCRLDCSGPQSCGRIRTLAVDNVVTCSGAGSCAGEFTCLGATCDARCADDACESGVDCRALSCDESSY